MKVAVFSARPYDRRFLEEANAGRLDFSFYDVRLDLSTCRLAEESPALCAFVNDDLGPDVLLRLFSGKTRMIALRCTGYNNVDFYSVRNLGFTVARVPVYSPQSISEYTIGLILALARKICRAWLRTREGNFSLDGLLGYNICDRKTGVYGTGRIGTGVAKILCSMGCEVVACDQYENEELVALGVRYVSQDELFRTCNLITLHCPLTSQTRHLIDDRAVDSFREGTMLVNTSRGGLVDTKAVIRGLKSGKISALALDVYEEESEFFFQDFSDRVIQDDVLARILNFPNVIITGHQAFFTQEAVRAIANQTVDNLLAFEHGTTPPGVVSWKTVLGSGANNDSPLFGREHMNPCETR